LVGLGAYSSCSGRAVNQGRKALSGGEKGYGMGMEIVLFTVESGRKSQQLQLIQVGLISSNWNQRCYKRNHIPFSDEGYIVCSGAF
jgi:hypothetical protein